MQLISLLTLFPPDWRLLSRFRCVQSRHLTPERSRRAIRGMIRSQGRERNEGDRVWCARTPPGRSRGETENGRESGCRDRKRRIIEIISILQQMPTQTEPQICNMPFKICCCCFSHSAHRLPTRKKTTLHGGQSRSWSAEQGKKKKKKSGSAPPPRARALLVRRKNEKIK